IAMKISGAGSFTGQRVHFIGIGGAGMSGLANVLLDVGAIVSGSDKSPNESTGQLFARGVVVDFEQDGSQLDKDISLVVRTAAVPDSNPEYVRAISLGLPTMKYAQLLGLVMGDRFGIAVGGTHGKTTTTSMIAFALLDQGIDPSVVIGGTVPQLGGSSRSGTGEHFVVEACEYDRSFLQLRPRVAVITNIEAEHLDVYKNVDDIIEAFMAFARLVPMGGCVIGCGEDVNVEKLFSMLDRPTITFGFGDAFDWNIEHVDTVRGCWHGIVKREGATDVLLKPSIPGRHNLINATCALATCVEAGLDPQLAADSISKFTGVDRRMTEMGKCNGAIIVDDYAHHPTEIRVTLSALRARYEPKRLICVFQPHQHSRTRILLDDFGTCFSDADETILSDIYAVRDTSDDMIAVSSMDVVMRIEQAGGSARHIGLLDDIAEELRNTIQARDVVVTMGAGNVHQVARRLVETKSTRTVSAATFVTSNSAESLAVRS
ncbi:MAG TPA: UDP-N-acetylmuramate--L-alanine ligase, partial [Tepidisphaeraceae bacterium]|nr:UDP-N-acetylmuramate--L-alanine ligase [Tepidisphaeraceae bacterium]